MSKFVERMLFDREYSDKVMSWVIGGTAVPVLITYAYLIYRTW